jgi:ABC-type sugar transport system ATPase subunit
MSKEQIVSLMAKDDSRGGKEQSPRRPSPRTSSGQARIEVEELCSAGHFQDVGLSAARGQILGIAGVQGSGHGDVVQAIAGVIPSTGRVTVNGVRCQLGKPAASFRKGILLVPADRRRAAIMGDLSVCDNITVSRRIRSSARRLGLRWPRLELQLTMEYVRRLSIRPASAATSIRYLSGGNQQKVVLARALEGNAQVLLVDEPTQGIDVHAKVEILRLLREYAAAGGCVIVATSEFEELRDLADEVVVLRQGRVAGRLRGDAINYRNILSHALP